MKKIIPLLLAMLLPACAMSTASAANLPPWPNQCPAGTAPGAIGCQPAAATPLPTDLVLGWEIGQTPNHTVAMQVQQLAGSLSGTFLLLTGGTLTGPLIAGGAGTGLIVDNNEAVNGSLRIQGATNAGGPLNAIGNLSIGEFGVLTGAATFYTSFGGTVTLTFPNNVSTTYTLMLPASLGSAGNVLASSGSSSTPMTWLTNTQLTADINIFTPTLSGAVPAPGSTGTTLYLRQDGTWDAPAGSGAVASVGFAVPAASIFGETGSPITSTGTINLTTTGTSGGIPYFSDGSTLSTSSALAANQAVFGAGAGAAPHTVPGVSATAGTPGLLQLGVSAASEPGIVQMFGSGSGSASLSVQGVADSSLLLLPNAGGTATLDAGAVSPIVQDSQGRVTCPTCGSGTINSATTGQLAFYPSSGTAISGTGVLTLSGSNILVNSELIIGSSSIATTTTNLAIAAAASPGAGVGHSLSLAAGTGGSSGAPGAITAIGGTAVASSTTGGAVTLTGGTGSGSSSSTAGGDVNINGGAPGLGHGGKVNIQGGADVIATATGGDVNITGGTGSSSTSSTIGGQVNIAGGAPGMGQGGDVAITGGASAATSGGQGGTVSLAGGNAAASGGGDVTLAAGSGAGIGHTGGAVSITSGAASGSSAHGGDITVAFGSGTSRNGLLIVPGLPSSNPSVSNSIWSDGGVLVQGAPSFPASGLALGVGVANSGGSLVSNAQQTITYSPGALTAVAAAPSHFTKWIKASTVDNMIVTADVLTCVTPPTIALLECGTSTTCATPTTIASVQVTSTGTATPASISNSAVAAGDYTAWEQTAGTCTALTVEATAQAHSN